MSIRLVMSGEFSSGEYQEVRFKQNFVALLNSAAQSQIKNPDCLIDLITHFNPPFFLT